MTSGEMPSASRVLLSARKNTGLHCIGLAVVFWLLGPALTSLAGSLDRAVIDETHRVVLYGNTRPEARPEFDSGPLDNSYRLDGIQLLLKRSPEREHAAEELADELQRPDSPHFHRWLDVTEYANRFGVDPQDLEVVRAWLRSHGFTVHEQSPSRMTIEFSGTAELVKEAFGTEMHVLDVNGTRHIANFSDPSIPAALAPVVEGIVSLNDFRPHAMHVPRPQETFSGNPPYYGVTPADLATIYNFKALFAAGITGRGQTIAVVEDTDLYTAADWTSFRQEFGLAAYTHGTLVSVHPGRCAGSGGYNEDAYEAILDAEWASAAAPDATIQVASCASSAVLFGGLTAIQNLVNQPSVPSVISLSYGECEVRLGTTGNAAYSTAYMQAALEGVSVYVSSGDQGSAGCDSNARVALSGIAVNGFASTAYNVAVGGTDFGAAYLGTTSRYWTTTNSPVLGSALSYIPEIPWNDSCASSLIASSKGFVGGAGPLSFCASDGYSSYNSGEGSGGPSNCAMGTGIVGGYGETPSNGTCMGRAKPSWQQLSGNPNDGVRDLPDVSLFASDGSWHAFYVFCESIDQQRCNAASGGTSFAAPIMAGMQALVDQRWGGRMGNPAPVLYAIARVQYANGGFNACNSTGSAGPSALCTFNDITIGDTATMCFLNNCFGSDFYSSKPGAESLLVTSYRPAFSAGPGWDFATGIGSVNAPNLVLDPTWLTGKRQ